MKRVSRALAVASLLLVFGCGSSKSSSDATAAAPDAGQPDPLVVARPYTLYVPDAYDASKPAPFVFLLHGYSAGGVAQEALFQITAAAKAHGFLYGYGDGTVDSHDNRFWNATDACCNFDHSPVDDVTYVNAVIDDVSRQYNVDPKRIYLIGHSNGAFMSHRLACDHASRIAAIVSLAGAQWEDPTKCAPTEPVSVLQVHGDQDKEISYAGGMNEDFAGNKFTYPSAHQTVATWAAKNGCTDALSPVGSIDVDHDVPGNETDVERYASCNGASVVELWTIHGAGHVPGITSTWSELVWGFMSAHPKP